MQEWFSLAEFAELGLPSLPASARGVAGVAERDEWGRSDWKDDRWRVRKASGGGFEYHYSVLDTIPQAALVLRLGAAAKDADAVKGKLIREDQWKAWERASDKKRARALFKLDCVQAVRAMVLNGSPALESVLAVARVKGTSKTNIYRWMDEARGIDAADQLAALAPRHAGRIGKKEVSRDAWEWLMADYLRLSQPAFADCYRRLVEKNRADAMGWDIPARNTLKRQVDALSPAMVVLHRQGTEAVKKLYPAQERDRGHFHALEAVNADGHKWDVFVKWPNGHVGRPVMIGFQDLYSGLILSWRVDLSETKELVRLAFGDLVESHGIPDHCWLDNGRAFASKWLTGKIANRYRFKVREEEPEGILTALGVQVHWVKPYSGQSKPIERAWRDFAGGIAKHPAFEGAYTGPNTTEKPENYASKAVPLETFLQVVTAGVVEHNARVGRRSRVCDGRLSFQQAFEDSYAKAPIRRATEAQRRLWLLAAESITVQQRDGSIELEGNRYWSDLLHPYRGQKVVIRFDPQALHADLHVYRADGVYLGRAPCVAAAGFNDVDAARAHERDRKAWIRGQRAMRDAEGRMTLDQLVAAMPATPEPEAPPAPKLVRLVTGNTVRIAAPDIDPDDDETPNEQLLRKAFRMQRENLRLVPREDADDEPSPRGGND